MEESLKHYSICAIGTKKRLIRQTNRQMGGRTDRRTDRQISKEENSKPLSKEQCIYITSTYSPYCSCTVQKANLT